LSGHRRPLGSVCRRFVQEFPVLFWFSFCCGRLSLPADFPLCEESIRFGRILQRPG
jgi:hypothetical protein